MFHLKGFNQRQQESGEPMSNIALRYMQTLADEFQSITLEELLRDHLVFGIRDDKVRERFLRESNLTLAKTNEICHAAESMEAQMRVVGSGDTTNTTVSV